MKNLSRSFLMNGVLAAALAACGGGSETKSPDASVKTPDAAPQPDAPPPDAARSCTAATFGAQDILDPGDASFIAWQAPLTTMPDGGPAALQFEFYAGSGLDPVTGMINLGAGSQNNYATCSACLRLITTDASGMLAKQFFQDGGTLNLTEDPFTTHKMVGTATDVSLVEVTIDSNTFQSTPVAGGVCLSLGTLTLNHDTVPNAWTCAKPAYKDGATCDCMCGIPDPDCAIAGAPVAGCTGAQVCDAGTSMCVAPVANDTCGTATPFMIGGTVNGTTVGATANYNAGLEATACTGFAQKGPEVVYSLTLTAGQAITVTLSNVFPATFDPSIALLGPGTAAMVCDGAAVTCAKGADAGVGGEGETFQFTATTAGTYFLVVDTFKATASGTFTLGVTSP